MPIRKAHLNREERASYLAATRELHLAGLDVDFQEERLQESSPLEVMVARGPATFVFDMPNSGVGYAIYVRLVARKAPLILPEYQIKTDWDDQIALVQIDEGGPTCKLGWLEYPRSEIVNQGFDNFLRFHYSGQMLEGTILATGARPIPPAYRTGAQVPFRLRFADPLGHEIGVEAALYVRRMKKRKNATVGRGTGLYEPRAPRETRALFPQGDFRLLERLRLETDNPEECQ